MRVVVIKIFLLITLLQSACIFGQDVTLDYIFQDTNIINPRPSLKQINAKSNKIFYYANDNYGDNLDLFDYNYITGETFKYSDTGKTPSEFSVLPNGDLLSIIDGDLFISKNFSAARLYTKDIQLTETEKYEYSPHVYGDLVIYRRTGNYFMLRFDSAKVSGKELQLTSDESDSVSYQILAVSEKQDEAGYLMRLLFARYDNTTKETFLFPNYSREFVSTDKQKRGISKVKLLEYEIKETPAKKDSLYSIITQVKYPDTVRYSTQYANYTPDNKNIILDVDAMDRHSRKIFNYDIAGKSAREIYTEQDTAWFERHSNAPGFTNDNAYVFESEIPGYNNLYRINTDGTGLKNITPGNYTVLESIIDRTKGLIYFTANPNTPVNYNLYKVNVDGSGFTQLTSDPGDVENLRITPDGDYLFYEHSYINLPNELYKFDMRSLIQTQITNTISPKFSQVNWVLPELVNFNNEEDGHLLYGFVYKPKDFNPKKKYPLICFVHGSGYLQNVTNGFSPYRDNFMVNTYLVSQGFIVLEVDFRGSLGYGKEHRNKTYRNLGYWEVSDYISGVNYLNGLGYINKDKVGLYGGSYGGFITLMALFRHPEVFKCGVALRAVANWKNYFYSNWWYTLARLGDYNNEENKKYYEQSSPITYAENLSVPLLLTHGMLDDNVFFQDMVQLTQKLIELKKDFDVMIYPKEYHGFHLQSSWLDQYKRIYKFFEKNLK
jgi:dipeptidyl aminopeptidase/acylaminoacyl peptidase